MASVSEVRTGAKVNDAILPGALPLSALVVDDDHCLLQVVYQMMEVFGFRTDSANGGHAAMRSLFQSRYDVVITDLQMPDMDGYALSGWVKSKFKNTKVIVMTGSNGSDLADFRHTGIVDRWLRETFFYHEPETGKLLRPQGTTS